MKTRFCILQQGWSHSAGTSAARYLGQYYAFWSCKLIRNRASKSTSYISLHKCISTQTFVLADTSSTCSDTILSSAILSSTAISLSVNVTTLSPKAAAISSRVLRLVSLYYHRCQFKSCVGINWPETHGK